MSNILYLRLTITILLIGLCISSDEKIKETTEMNKESGNFDKIIESITAIFFSGFLDRSFFITAFMAFKYSKLVVLSSAGISLTLVGVLSIYLGMYINRYIDTLWIDVVAVSLFFFLGIKMVIEGVNIPKNQDLLKLEEAHRKLQLDENERLIKVDENGNYEKIIEPSSVEVFFKIFFLLFFSEMGDRSQISTIYLSKNVDNITLMIAVIVAQNLLTVIAIIGGKLISNKISERNLTIIAGSVFILYGFIALYFLCVNDLLIFKKNNANVNDNDFIPDKNTFLPLLINTTT